MLNHSEKAHARRLAIAATRHRWAAMDAEVAARRAVPQTAEQVESSRAYLAAAFGLTR